MNVSLKLIVASGLVLSSSVSQAYKIATHDKLSQETALCSVLNQDNFVKGIGWETINNKNGTLFKRPELIEKNGGSIDLTTQQLIGWGTQFEDEAAKIRPVNHFFNPLTSGGGSAGFASPDWALEDNGANVLQKFSFSDANKMIVDASSLRDKNERKKNWGEVLQTLGIDYYSYHNAGLNHRNIGGILYLAGL